MENKDIVLYFDIVEKLYTREQADSLSEEIRNLLNHLFDTNIPFNQKLTSYLSPDTHDRLVRACDKTAIDYHNEAVFEKYLANLREMLKTIPTITVYVAFTPTQRVYEHLSQWLLSTYHKKYLFDVQIKPEILGGAVFVYNGIYKDFSLKSRLATICQSLDYSTILGGEIPTYTSRTNLK